MIKGLFSKTDDFAVLRRLQATADFQVLVGKLRTVHTRALADLLTGPLQDAHDRRGYTRAIDELITEFTRNGVSK